MPVARVFSIGIIGMLAAVTFIAMLLVPTPSASHEPPKGSSITIVGHVVDTACYLTHGAQGEKHVECAQPSAPRKAFPWPSSTRIAARSTCLWLPNITNTRMPS